MQFNQTDAQILQNIILNRRDVRGNRFSNKPLPDSLVIEILSAALHAPSVGFSQPWEFVVIRDPKTKSAITASFEQENQQARSIFEGAKQQQYQSLKLEGIMESPVNIAVFYKPSQTPVLGQTSMPEVGRYSVVCAIQNMWLMARALNIGMGWVSILSPLRVKEILNAPLEYELIGYFCLGYVTEFLPKPELESLKWASRKDLEECLIYETYA